MTRPIENKQYITNKFSQWLRSNSKLDSKESGTVITDIDYIFLNFKSGDTFIGLETKCRCQEVKFPQSKILLKVHTLFKASPDYKGFFVLIFEHESADDGRIWLRRLEDTQALEITKEDLTQFLLDFKMVVKEDN